MANILPHLLNVLYFGFHLFVDDDIIRHAQIGFTGMIGDFVTGAQRIDDHEVQVRSKEGHVVVAAIPKDDVRLLFRLPQNLPIIHSGIDHRAAHQMRLELFHLLDGAVMLFQIDDGLEPLHPLLHQIAVGHRMTNDDHSLAFCLQ